MRLLWRWHLCKRARQDCKVWGSIRRRGSICVDRRGQDRYRLCRCALRTVRSQLLAEGLPGLGRRGLDSQYFTPQFLFLCICHGILFEIFSDDGDEGNIIREITRSAIQMVNEHFPLAVYRSSTAKRERC